MPNPIPEDRTAELAELIFSGRKIPAIKLYRELTGLGLKEAKHEIEMLEEALRKESPGKFTATPKGRGCLSAAALLLFCGGIVTYWMIRS